MHLLGHESFRSNLTLCFLEARVDFELPIKAAQGVVTRKGWKTGVLVVLNKARTTVADFSINCSERLHFGHGIPEYITRRVSYGELVGEVLISMKQSLMTVVREWASSHDSDEVRRYATVFLHDQGASLPN